LSRRASPRTPAGSSRPKDIRRPGPVARRRLLAMLVEMTELLGRQVYTPEGRLLGEVDNVVVDVEAAKIDGLYVDETSPMLVEDSRPTNVPYRWVSAVNDVVLLKYFPRRVSVKKASTRAVKEEAPVAPAAR
jgi:sporulation protein YlmC with PRC-barrel domain